MRIACTGSLVLGLQLALTACGGSSGGSIAAPPAEPGVLVQGRVVGLAGVPTAEMLVAVVGHEPVITDTDGRFTTADVAIPYSVAVFPHGTTASASLFVGLTRLDPTLQLLGAGAGIRFSAEVNGAVVGGAGFPEPLNHTTIVHQNLVDAELNGGGVFGPADPVTGNFGPFAIGWKGPTSIEVGYRALQMSTDAVTGRPVTYTGYGTRTVQVSAGDALLNQDITLAPVGQDVIAGTTTVAPGYEFNRLGFALEYSSHDADRVFVDSDPAPVFTYNVPAVAGTTLTLSGTAQSLDGLRYCFVTVRGVAPGTTGIQLDFPAAPIGTFPPDGANGVDTGWEFYAEDVADRVYEFSFLSGVGPYIFVFTDQPFARLPDLSAYGLSLPPMASYTWRVRTLGPFEDVDEATGPAGVQPPGLPIQTVTGSRTFTTAP